MERTCVCVCVFPCVCVCVLFWQEVVMKASSAALHILIKSAVFCPISTPSPGYFRHTHILTVPRRVQLLAHFTLVFPERRLSSDWPLKCTLTRGAALRQSVIPKSHFLLASLSLWVCGVLSRCRGGCESSTPRRKRETPDDKHGFLRPGRASVPW